MASKSKSPSNELVLTPEKAKRTRNVIKWQDAHERATCAMISIFMDNKDFDPAKLAMVGRKVQLVLESVAQTVKDGKVSKDMVERRDNLELALQVAGITNSNVIKCLDEFISLFK